MRKVVGAERPGAGRAFLRLAPGFAEPAGKVPAFSSRAPPRMPKAPNTALRLAVPLIVLALGVGLVWLFFRSSSNKPTPAPAPATQVDGTAPAPDQAQAAQPGAARGGEAQPAAGATPGVQPGAAHAATGIAAGPLVLADWGAVPPPPTLGSELPGTSKVQVRLSRAGVGVGTFWLNESFLTIKREQRVVVQAEHRLAQPTGADAVLAPMAALAIEVTPSGGATQTLALYDEKHWKPDPVTPAAFVAEVRDSAGNAVLRVHRRYELRADLGGLDVHQRIENVSGSAISCRWFQVGPVDMPVDDAGYGGEKRRVRFGYLLSPEMDPTRSVVVSDGMILPRAKVLGERGAAGFGEVAAWPTPDTTSGKYSLTWVGVTNRYFGAAVHPLVDPSAKQPEKVLGWVDRVTRIVLDAGPGHEVMALRLDSKPLALAPAGQSGAGVDLSTGLYAGPLDKATIRQDASLDSLGVAGLVYYNFGGMCGFCTFAWLTGILYGILHFLHDSVFRDWALAIIFLVVIVRGCLHPVTRWSQIKTARFGKQMQAVGPKQKALQEKFRDDPMKLQQETRKLWAEEGISPAGFLGCLPMFLQTPVWIALYATLYFAFELRHQGAFYGVFQSLQGQGSPFWWFLGDLAEPDRFWYFAGSPDKYISIPVLSGLMGKIGSVNVLPLVLGVVFFIQQKYMTPATQATTPEQEMQMKMMKWMTVFMFPLLMYNAPAGLSIYFIANSTLGIIESKWIRRHMEKHGMLDLDKMRAERQKQRSAKGGKAPSGFMAKLTALAEEAQKRQSGKGGR